MVDLKLFLLLFSVCSLSVRAHTDDDFAEFDDEEGEFDFDLPGEYYEFNKSSWSTRSHTTWASERSANRIKRYACYITEEDVDHGTSEAVDDFDDNGEMVSTALGRRWH